MYHAHIHSGWSAHLVKKLSLYDKILLLSLFSHRLLSHKIIKASIPFVDICETASYYFQRLPVYGVYSFYHGLQSGM
jgi:hypothetical protein